MKLLESIGGSVKAAAVRLAPSRETPFAATGGYGVSNGNGGPYLAGLHNARSPGSMKDWEAKVGDPLDNRVVAACVMAKTRAHNAAPIVLQKRRGEKWNNVGSHPLLDLLNFPNEEYGADDLWAGNIAQQCARGNGFWRVVLNRARTEPAELWYEPTMVPEYDAMNFVKDYWLRVDGKPYRQIPASQFLSRRYERCDFAIHFRYHLDPRNPRWGWTPLFTALRQVHGDNLVATHHVSVLENGGSASRIISPKEGAEVDINKLALWEKMMDRKLRGDGAGRNVVSTQPIDIHKGSYSPEEMALDKLPAYFETSICAELEVPPLILSLLSGDSVKTYSNLREAILDFWNRSIIPFQNRNLTTLETQLFPFYGLDRSDWKLECDRSQIDALKEDEEKLFDMLFQGTQKPFMKRNEARERVHLAPVEDWDGEDEAPKSALLAKPSTAPGDTEDK